ncbi:GTP cyclohydrolase I FolE [Caldithrix abyssi]|uniref:GTP cyclohydrolase 1 n=1 Tax=Caldithrix abyssi DSM 13497 TaxID=880073 RepID=H1XX36_CALAY|nr:GTP cyclohydrolase I FolE [Caldithrix abyssi]APF20728.1 folE GTP cyclohydrolase I [Caldithrix abyssi DSM 13497]EHO40773.1 GTP cyclohydrolase 1 [Caldithrix abyssi DSM 13497]
MKSMEEAVRQILLGIGEDPERQGLKNTPFRVAKMFREVTKGYQADPQKIINNAIFDVDYDEMVVVANIEYYSLCEHHLLPFFGVVHVGYIPRGKVVGLSKIPRIVDMFARRLQIQEKMTLEIAHLLNDALDPDGVGVVVEGQHMCMMMRGVQKDKAKMITSAMLGSFKDDEKTRAEFLSLIRSPRVEAPY